MSRVRVRSAVAVDRDAVGESARLVEPGLEDLIPEDRVFVSLGRDDSVLPGAGDEAVRHDGLVRGDECDPFAVGVVDDARLNEAPPVGGTRGGRMAFDSGPLRADDVEVPDRHVLDHLACRRCVHEDASPGRVVSLVSVNRQIGSGAAAGPNREDVCVHSIAQPNHRGIGAGSEDPDVGSSEDDR